MFPVTMCRTKALLSRRLFRVGFSTRAMCSFPGGGAQLPDRAVKYIDHLANGTVRTALDTGCGLGVMDNQRAGVEHRHGKHPLESNMEEDDVLKKECRRSSDRIDMLVSIGGSSLSHSVQSDGQRHAGDSSDASSLIEGIGRDNSISCLIRCSRLDYGALALLNRSFHSLIRSGELYKLRRQNGIVEHWVYFSWEVLKWVAFAPTRCRWMELPPVHRHAYVAVGVQQSLAVGTELLVFGIELGSSVIHRYSLLSNTWSTGMNMNESRSWFGSASLGEIGILAGGQDSNGKILDSVELYNSETGTWKKLPRMRRARKMCSGVFMDGKFYVIGGTGGAGPDLLTCGEEYDFDSETWSEVPNMSPMRPSAGNEDLARSGAPPLIAVVDNELYAADNTNSEVRKYNKSTKSWITIGRLPVRVVPRNGWGVAFRGCGDRLLVIGGPLNINARFIEINAWTPREGPLRWELLGLMNSSNYVYSSAVMGC